VHRHQLTHGFLNAGELEYWVKEDGTVRQVNVLTGEAYEHPSLEALFHQSSAKTNFGGVTWTIRKAGGDSFFIDFVGCPNQVCEVYVPLKSVRPETRSVTVTAGVQVTRFMGWTWTTVKTDKRTLLLEDVDLLDKLRRYCAGKARNPRLRTECLNYARRLCNKADIISIHGGGAHEIEVASMVDYVHAAFYADVQHELEIALAYHKNNAAMVDSLNSLYEGNLSVVDLVPLQKAMDYTVTKTVSASRGVLSAIDRELGPYNFGRNVVHALKHPPPSPFTGQW